MIRTLLRRPARAHPVRVHASDGHVGLEAACLFTTPGDWAVHALIERLFYIEAVRAVELDRDRCTVAIDYDRTVFPPAAVLTRFSEVLGATVPSQEPSVLSLCLEPIAGRVKRVERSRRRVAADHGSVARPPDQPLPSESRPAWCRRGAAATTARPAAWRHNLIIVADELLVEYEPALAKPTALSAAASTPNGADHEGSRTVAPTASQQERLGPSRGESLAEAVRRAANLTAAGGCFALSIIGVWTPGIPTVPFVLATSYFLARSSPTLHEKFRRSRLFGPMVRDWEVHGGLRLGTKLKLVAITFAIIGVTILVAGISPVLLIVMGVMTGISLFIVLRLPTVTERSPNRQLAVATA
jgi:uncharacterized membrane protein YbaN (DUF454 family)